MRTRLQGRIEYTRRKVGRRNNRMKEWWVE
jgi:hypothetical protein